LKLVFIHGRAQEHKTSGSLRAEWLDALKNGLADQDLRLPIPESSVAAPYYGDKLFSLTESLGQIETDAIARGGAVTDPMLAFEAEVLEELRQKAGISDEAVQAEFGDDPSPKGAENWRWVQAIVRAIDRWSPGVSNASLKLILRDVYVYINRSGIAAEVDEIVTQAITTEPLVVVAHSLGTVVAYNILRRDPRVLDVAQLITVGSPLGIEGIKRQLRPLRSPPVGGWFNGYDPRDIVALNPLDGANFPVTPSVENKGDVDNFTDNRHGIAGYLSDRAVARRIYRAVGGVLP
jgi:hypothetical protein